MTPPDSTGPDTARQRLLDAAIEHLSRHGISDLSLRPLAAALGTSHRMLIYHFGSKEGLLVAVVQAMEARQRAALGDLTLEPGASVASVTRTVWRRIADPSLWPIERLFFEVYGQALQGRPHAAGLLDEVIDPWLAPSVAALRARGMDEPKARAEARLGLAVMRGLLLDLLSTGDRAGVDAALEEYLAGYEARNPG